MANIKISELNELLPGQKAYDDYLAIVDSSADETKKISVETLTSTGIKLIAVSSTAPTEFSNGDKYYNSTTNRIYEARTDVWYNPQEPVEGIFYIILDSQNIYTYDKENETLVNVGSASGSVVNNYSTSSTQGYSCNYVNKFGKKLWEGSFTSGSITIDNFVYYNFYAIKVGSVYAFGSRNYGFGGIITYGSYGFGYVGYRLGGTGNTLTIDSYNKGGSNGQSQEAITEIWGLF